MYTLERLVSWNFWVVEHFLGGSIVRSWSNSRVIKHIPYFEFKVKGWNVGRLGGWDMQNSSMLLEWVRKWNLAIYYFEFQRKWCAKRFLSTDIHPISSTHLKIQVLPEDGSKVKLGKFCFNLRGSRTERIRST